MELGIQLQSDGLAQEPVNTDITTELKLTRRSTELVLEPSMELKITLPLKLMLLKRTLLLLEDSHTTELLITTTLWLEEELLVPERDQ